MNKTELLQKTKTELLKVAQRLGLRGVSTLNKPELAVKITEAQQRARLISKQPLGVAAVAQRVEADLKRRAVRKRVLPTAAARTRPTTARIAAKPAAKIVPPAKTPTPKPSEEITAGAAAEISAHKFDVTPKPPPPKQVFHEEHLGELPEAYGTGRLFLTARDPHWLFAYWDFTWQQMADYRGQAADGRLLLRVFEKNHTSPIQELTLQHDSRSWYIPVNKAATSFSAQLGFWRHDGSFHAVSRSGEAMTPADVVSPDTTAKFVTIPIDLPFRELLTLIRAHMRHGERLADALQRLQAEGFRFPFKVGMEVGPWSDEQAAALERIMGGDIWRRIQMDSFEITEWLRRRMQEEMSSGMFSAFSPAGASWSQHEASAQKGFWFAVNAELVIYGATEPNAKVTVDGKPIKLRSDGTFSFHHVFPDGQYKVPVVAISATGEDQRAAELSFQRKSKTVGDVGKVKQAAHLKSPAAA